MKLFNFLKSLFSKKSNETSTVVANETTVEPTPVVYDAFGYPIAKDDHIIYINYNELNRRGYVTLHEMNYVYTVVEPADYQTDTKYILRINTIRNNANITNSRRQGFIHLTPSSDSTENCIINVFENVIMLKN